MRSRLMLRGAGAVFLCSRWGVGVGLLCSKWGRENTKKMIEMWVVNSKVWVGKDAIKDSGVQRWFLEKLLAGLSG